MENTEFVEVSPLILELRLKVLNDINDNSKDDLFEILLKNAKYIALNTLFPFDLDTTELPKRVEEDWVVRCALELYQNMEDGSYTSYSENGLSWTKSSELISYKLLSELTPKAGVPR